MAAVHTERLALRRFTTADAANLLSLDGDPQVMGARVLVGLAFTGLGVREVVATTMAVNTGSRRVMEKAGLRSARTVHLDWPEPFDGNEHGEAEYRLLRERWLK